MLRSVSLPLIALKRVVVVLNISRSIDFYNKAPPLGVRRLSGAATALWLTRPPGAAVNAKAVSPESFRGCHRTPQALCTANRLCKRRRLLVLFCGFAGLAGVIAHALLELKVAATLGGVSKSNE